MVESESLKYCCGLEPEVIDAYVYDENPLLNKYNCTIKCSSMKCNARVESVSRGKAISDWNNGKGNERKYRLTKTAECPNCSAEVDVTKAEEYEIIECCGCNSEFEYFKGTLVEEDYNG